MKQKPPRAAFPRPAQETVRRTVIDLIRDQPLSAKEISAQAHITEKEVYSHLEHIRLSIQASGGHLEIIPSECRSCGFVFTKRDRLNPPGRCPICRHEFIFDPIFAIRQLNPDEA
ncbi:MAG TPA: transcriptional regulator [Desulfuromonadaceae bacterium]|jgi:hypothetical protein